MGPVRTWCGGEQGLGPGGPSVGPLHFGAALHSPRWWHPAQQVAGGGPGILAFTNLLGLQQDVAR